MTSTTDVRPAAEQVQPSRWATLRPVVLRLHFYAGVLIAPFLLVAATTGLLYASSYQIESIVYRHELTATPGETKLPLAQQVDAARRAHPSASVTAVRPGAEPDQTTRVLLDVPGLAESTSLAVFVNPYTAEVHGSLESYGSSGALPIRAWISTLHRNLHLGEPGRIYSELAASWLGIVALGGLILWLSRRRRKGLRGLFAPSGTGPGRTVSRHGSLGLWIVLGLFFLSATGLTWSKYAGENVDALRAALNWTTPSIAASAGDHGSHSASGHHAAATDVDVDRVAQAAAEKNLSGPIEIAWPSEPGGTYVVKEIDKLVPQRLDQVAVDPASGNVTAELRFADYPVAAKLARWGIDGHQGLLFGLVNQILLIALAVGIITLIVLGYRTWWRRRPTKGFGRPYERTSWRRSHWLVLVPVAVAVGYFLPLMGISLVAFLVIDTLLGLRDRSAAVAGPDQ